MKNIKYITVFIITIGLILVSTSSIFAGSKYDYNVSININQFSGSIGTARNSVDNLQYIGCWYYDNGDGTCYARNSVGTLMVCNTNSPSLLSSIRSINSDSYIRVTVNAGNCTSIFVSNASFIRPK